MAVTINEMQVDVDKRSTPNTSAETAKAKEKFDLRGQMELRAERELRLKAD